VETSFDEIAMGRGLRLPALDPWQSEICGIDTPPFKDAPRSIHREFDNRPIPM
jgi:hypothetical protein